MRYRTAAQTEFNLTEAIDQLRDFLGVIGLVALLLGGIGVASGVNAFVMRKIDTVAILRCLGATSRQVLTIYLLQAAVMGLVGAAAGAVLGIGLQFVLPERAGRFPSGGRRRHASSRPRSAWACSSACGSRWCSRCARWSRCAT